jgi:hypothetical protein
MSQREKAGLSCPRFSVGAGEPFGVGPEAVSCATACICKSDKVMPMLRPVFATDLRLRSKNASGVPFAGSLVGVAQLANCGAFPWLSGWPHFSARGVGQEESFTCLSKSICPFGPDGR